MLQQKGKQRLGDLHGVDPHQLKPLWQYKGIPPPARNDKEGLYSCSQISKNGPAPSSGRDKKGKLGTTLVKIAASTFHMYPIRSHWMVS